MPSHHLNRVALFTALGAVFSASTALAQDAASEGTGDAGREVAAPAASDDGPEAESTADSDQEAGDLAAVDPPASYEGAEAPEPLDGEAQGEPTEEGRTRGRASRLHNHATGLGWHAVIFRTEDGDRYVLNGPSVSYDYFVGRDKWGFAVHGATYLPIFGRFDGPDDFQGSLRSGYGDRRYGFDLLLQLAYRQPLNEELVLFFGGGLHVQSFRLDGEAWLPVEAITLGFGGSIRLQWDFHPHMHIGTKLSLGLDPFDLVRHYNRAVLTGTLDGSFYFGVRF